MVCLHLAKKGCFPKTNRIVFAQVIHNSCILYITNTPEFYQLKNKLRSEFELFWQLWFRGDICDKLREGKWIVSWIHKSTPRFPPHFLVKERVGRNTCTPNVRLYPQTGMKKAHKHPRKKKKVVNIGEKIQLSP